MKTLVSLSNIAKEKEFDKKLIEEISRAIKHVYDWNGTKKSKQAVVDRFDLDCPVRSNDIILALREKIMELTQESTDERSLQIRYTAWWNIWNAPSSPKKIAKALEGQPEHFVRFIVDNATKQIPMHGKNSVGKIYVNIRNIGLAYLKQFN